MTKTTCSADACQTAAGRRGLCRKHYQRAIRSGALTPRARSTRTDCERDDCGQPRWARNLCKNHYQQQLDRSRGTCRIDDCVCRARYASGLCKRHQKDVDAMPGRGTVIGPHTLEEYDFLCSFGTSPERVAARLGIDLDTIRRAKQRQEEAA